MHPPKNLFYIFVCVFLTGAVPAHAEDKEVAQGYSDPLNPQGGDELSVAPNLPFYKISNRLEQLALQIEEDQRAMYALPRLQTTRQFDAFGYHSDYIPAVEGVPEKPLWTLGFDVGIPNRRILGVVMIPAIDERTHKLKGYAFPKRFRISSTNRNGGAMEVLVDWTEEDFPNPGMRPVIFRFPEEYAKDPATNTRKGLRLEIFSGHEEDGLEFVSLARLQLIRFDELQSPKKIEVSSSFESAPYWGVDYLASKRHTLGMPLSSSGGTGGDLVMKMPSSKLEEPVVLRMELGEYGHLGWLSLFPGHSPDGIDVPGYGFPKTMRIFPLVLRNDGKTYRPDPVEGIPVTENPGNSMIQISDAGVGFSAVEIVCNDFPVYQGQAVFSLGEIEVFSKGKNLSKGRRVTIQSPHLDEIAEVGVLTDGRVDGGSILELLEWTDQLAAGKAIQSRLTRLKAERSRLTDRWAFIRSRVLALAAFLTISGVAAFVFFMLLNKKRTELRLRRQIHSDLHDEVGSNLGSISLMTGQLQGIAKSDGMKEGLVDLSLMTREAYSSLREVVWMVDESKVRLPALIEKLGERVERVLNGMEITLEIPKNCPDKFVSLNFKRHFIMFFKEVIHNCARHSNASCVKVAISVTPRQLQISFSDNGRGFVAESSSDGWGLGSIRQRAAEMCAEMKLTSFPGDGTKVVLDIPLTALSRDPNQAYKTSN